MDRVSVLYMAKSDGKFDMDYYVKSHMPMVKRLMGDKMLRYEVAAGTSSANGSNPAVTASVMMYVQSAEAFSELLRSHGKEIMGDVKHYTNIEPIIVLEKVVPN